MTIEPLSEEYAINIWNKFVSQYPGITPFSFNPSLFHFYKKYFNWKPYYILVFSKGEICAILPLVNTDKAIVSLPHLSYGGILNLKNIENNIAKIIFDKLITVLSLQDHSAGFYEYHMDDENELIEKPSNKFLIRSLESNSGDKFLKSEKVTSILNLPKAANEFNKILSTNLKRKIRKAVKSDINIKSGGEELLDDFYEVYCRNIFHLKSLNYSKKLIADLLSSYQFGEIKIFVAYRYNKVIGAGLMASYNGFYENMLFATNNDARKYYVSDLLHYEMIKYAITNNTTENNTNAVYSFGRSTLHSGVHKYKSHWPIYDMSLYVYSNMVDIKKHQWIKHLWGILPSIISKPLGAKLIKHIY